MWEVIVKRKGRKSIRIPCTSKRQAEIIAKVQRLIHKCSGSKKVLIIIKGGIEYNKLRKRG